MSLHIGRPRGILSHLSFAWSRDWVLLSWRRSSDGQLNMISIRHSAYILSGSSKHIFQIWWKSIQLFPHDVATITQKRDFIYLYEKLWFLLYALCVRSFPIAAFSWNGKSEEYLWSSAFLSIQSNAKIFPIQPHEPVGRIFPEVKSYLIVSLNSWLLKLGMSSMYVSCSPKLILYILAMGGRSEAAKNKKIK